MVISSLAAGVAGSSAGHAYQVANLNRANWEKDNKIKQGQRFHQHGLLVTQARMFREDVRDLVRTASQQQHNLVLVGTLILGYAFRLLNAGMPTTAPQFMDKLYYICAAIAFLYLLLAVICALCSIQLSMKCERDMLTSTVRLPIEDMIGEVQEQGWEYTMAGFEHQSLATILRVPGLGRLMGKKPEIRYHGERPQDGQARASSAHAAASARAEDQVESAFPSSSPAILGSSSGRPEPSGFNFITIDVLKERCKAHRREFYAKEAEWTSISKYSPYFILWGMENLLYAEAYWHTAEMYEDGNTDGFIRMMFFLSVALFLCIVSNNYTSRTLSQISPAWAVLDVVVILAVAALCVFANLYGSYYDGWRWATGVAIELLYLCHLVKHVCQAMRLHRAFKARARQDHVEDELDGQRMLPRTFRTDSSSGPDTSSDDDSFRIQSRGAQHFLKPSTRSSELHRAVRWSIFASAVIVSVTWIAAGVHDWAGGPKNWRGCVNDPGNPLKCRDFYGEAVNRWLQAGPRDAQPQGGNRRLDAQAQGGHFESLATTWPRAASAPSAEQATPRSGSGLILVALNISGERKLVRHPGSTLIGDVVRLHQRSSLHLRGSSTVFDSQGVELGDDVPLMAVVQSGDAVTEGVLDLFIK